MIQILGSDVEHWTFDVFHISKTSDAGGGKSKVRMEIAHALFIDIVGAIELLFNPFLLNYNPRFIAFAQKIGVMPKESR
jgi:hypothetical protein